MASTNILISVAIKKNLKQQIRMISEGGGDAEG